MDFLVLLFSFCGGIIGAAFAPVTSFVVVGFTGLLGVIAVISGSQFDWIGVIPLGPLFGPNIAFVGGVAAAAFAGRKGFMETGKDIVKPLASLKKPSVLLVGGIFGILGYSVNHYIGILMPGKIDSLALTIVILGLLGKLIFSSQGIEGIVGKVPQEVKSVGGRYSVRSSGVWLPWMNTAFEKAIIAIGIGGGSAYITYIMLQNPSTAPVAAFVGFFLSAASLIWLEFGHPIPVTHHITLCASYATVASGGNLIWGIAGALIAAFSADFLAKTFNTYGGDAHVDPPSMGIAFTSVLLLGIFPFIGFYTIGITVPIVVIAFTIINIIYEERKIKSVSLKVE